MKILQLTNKIPYPPKDGGAIATLNISTGLSKLGHEVTLLGMNTRKHYSSLKDLPAELSNTITFHDVEIDTALSVFAAGTNLLFSRLPYNAVRFFRKEYSRALTDLLSKHEFDVIQLEGLYMAWYIPLIRRYSGALISLRAHNIEHEIWERTAAQEKSWFKRWYLRVLARRIKNFKMQVLNSYDVLIPITERDSAHFSVTGNTTPVHVVPAGFDMDEMQPEPHRMQFPDTFFIGTLDWFPNQEGLVWFLENVWDKLLTSFPDLVFHVAGRNAPPWIQQLLQSKRNVIYHGEIEDARAYIHEHAIMIVPLFSGSGMRVKIIEGMALGKTIVTTSIGAEGIPVEPGTNIIIEDEAEAFADQVVNLVKNRTLFDQMGQNAARFVRERFDNRNISAGLADFYQIQLDRKKQR